METELAATAEPPEKPRNNRNAPGGPPGNGKHLKHGYYSLVKLIRNRGGALDRRTILGKMVKETIQDLTASLGGDLSVQEQMLVDDVALDTLLLKSLNNVVATVQPLRKGKAHAAYQLRAQLISQRREHLRLLGLKRVAKNLSLQSILAREDNGENPNEDTDTPPNAEASGDKPPNTNGAADDKP